MTFMALNMKTIVLVMAIIASIFVAQSSALNLIISDGNGLMNVTTLLSPRTTTGPSNYNITAVPIIADPVDSCTSFTNAADMLGKIVIVEWGTCSPMVKTRLAQANGALAVLVREPLAVVPGQYFSMIDGSDLSDIVIPMLYIAQPTSDEIKKALEMTGVNVDVTVWPEAGPWEIQNEGYGVIIYWAPIQAGHLALAIWASFLLITHIIQYQKKKVLPLIILPIIIVASIVRIFFFFITAMLQSRVPAFNLPVYATFIIAPFSEAVLQVAFALIAFTWYEAMTQTKSVPKTFSKMRVPAIICSVIVAGATSIINIISSALYSTLIIAVTGIIAMLFYIALFVLYLIAAIKLYRILFRADAHRSADHNQKMQNFIRRVIALLIAIFLNLIGSIFLLTMGSDPVLFTWFVYPIGRGVFILISMYIATSFFQLSYVPASSKSKSKGKSSGSGDGSKKGTTAAGDSTKGDASATASLRV